MAKDFTFKQFHINAYQCGMPVSTDAILLGAWANIDKATHILDIGCGTGLLAIMCAQRNATANIVAVEIEKNAYKAACINMANSPWAKRLSVTHSPIEEFVNLRSNTIMFDAIICNPPYFNNGLESKNAERAIARHTSSLTHQHLLHYCKLLLKDQGTASFVLPKDEGLSFIGLLQNSNKHLDDNDTLEVSRFTYVKTTNQKPATRVLIELTKQRKSAEVLILRVGHLSKSEIIIHEGTGYSSEFIQLTKAFYLKM